MNFNHIASVLRKSLCGGQCVSDIVFISRQGVYTRLFDSSQNEDIDGSLFLQRHHGIRVGQQPACQRLIDLLLSLGDRHSTDDNWPESRQIDFAMVQHLHLERFRLPLGDEIGRGDQELVTGSQQVNTWGLSNQL